MNIIETLLWNVLYWTLYLPLSLVIAPEANTAIIVGIGTFCSIIFTAIIARVPGIIMPRKQITTESPQQPTPEPEQEIVPKKHRAKKKEKTEQPMEVNPYAKENPTTPINGVAQDGLRPNNTPDLHTVDTDDNNGFSTDSSTTAIE